MPAGGNKAIQGLCKMLAGLPLAEDQRLFTSPERKVTASVGW